MRSRSLKLSDEQAIEVHRRLLLGESGDIIAKDFGVCAKTVYCISKCLTFKHLNLSFIPRHHAMHVRYHNKPMAEKLSEKSKLNPENGCIEWTASISGVGYGNLRIMKQTYLAHRLSYETHVGPIPDGMCVMHKCDNRKCINPDHLTIGTHEDNSQDMVLKNRSTAGEKHTHAKLTKETAILAVQMSKDGIPTQKIAEEFGVTHACIFSVLRGSSWSKSTGIPKFIKKKVPYKRRIKSTQQIEPPIQSCY